MVYVLLLTFLFTIFFIFDFRLFRSLNEYKFFKGPAFFSSTLIVTFFSLAGVPPFLGFFAKLLLFAAIFYTSNFFYFLLFIFLNLFFIFFYIQNVRFLVGKTQKNIYFYKNFRVFMNFGLISLLVLFNFLNLFAIIFFEPLLIFINQMVFFIRIY